MPLFLNSEDFVYYFILSLWNGQAPAKIKILENKCLLSSCAYHVSSPCVLLLASLRSEEGKVPEVICCHGNDVTHMRTKFHLHV